MGRVRETQPAHILPCSSGIFHPVEASTINEVVQMVAESGVLKKVWPSDNLHVSAAILKNPAGIFNEVIHSGKSISLPEFVKKYYEMLSNLEGLSPDALPVRLSRLSIFGKQKKTLGAEVEDSPALTASREPLCQEIIRFVGSLGIGDPKEFACQSPYLRESMVGLYQGHVSFGILKKGLIPEIDLRGREISLRPAHLDIRWSYKPS